MELDEDLCDLFQHVLVFIVIKRFRVSFPQNPFHSESHLTHNSSISFDLVHFLCLPLNSALILYKTASLGKSHLYSITISLHVS